jgi:hypothetical protein
MQAATTERLMRPRGVVPMNPVGTRTSGFGEVAEVMLPDTPLLEATKAETTSGVILDNPHLYEPASGPGREFGLCEADPSGVAKRLQTHVVAAASFVMKKLGSTTL